MSKILGLDVGDTKIGIAISDRLGFIAYGFAILKRRNIYGDIQYIQRLIREQHVDELVVGLPIKMDGHKSRQTEKTLIFTKLLRKQLNIPVHTWDERLTTVEAIKTLKSGKIRRKQRAHLIDKVAATIILQSYLDRKNYRNHPVDVSL
ncbi:MAG TPA: Holliday junction resolvase RuvX [Candidatus Limnocylindrales bacterium]|nr:Holliday junction resolvase RuvX [Candidatus Limnocylindrales bacterium]